MDADLSQSANWCDIAPACNANETSWEGYGALGDSILANASNDSDLCNVPFCPNILYYSIKDSKYVLGVGHLKELGWVTVCLWSGIVFVSIVTGFLF